MKLASIVLDTGGDSIKCGFSNQSKPEFILPTKVGHYPNDCDNIRLMGHDLNKSKSDDSLKIAYPVERGFVKNWHDLECLFSHLYEKCLQVDSDEYAVMASEPPGITSANREKLAQILFEKFKVPKLCLKNQSVLTLHSYGKTTGLVVDVGHSVTYVVPICQGNALNHAMERYYIGGRDISNYVANCLDLQSEPYLAREIKENFCYVKSEDDSTENAASYELPDGKVLNLTREQRYYPSEVLFKPMLIDMDIMGLHEIAYKTIAKTQIDLRRDLYANIFLAGGSSLLNGLSKRIEQEIKLLAPKSIDVNVKENESRQFSSWMGGNILASLENFQNEMCISLSEYKENGSSIITKKFLPLN